MVILLFFISLLVCISCCIVIEKTYRDIFHDVASIIAHISFFVLIASLFAMLLLCIEVVCGRNLDSKIEMYQSENAKIEQQINNLVSNYIDFEKDTFTDLKVDDSITLISMYPELKSDKLVMKQIDTYVENNKTIKELKTARIDLNVYKWWLYFGN